MVEPLAAGTPRRRVRGLELTERDAAALSWIAQQYGATLEVLDVLLGRLGGSSGPLSRWGTRNQLDRWRRAGWVSAERVLGDMWVTPTRRGLDKVGLSLPVWPVPATRVRHCHAINVVRLHCESVLMPAGTWWVSERQVYRDRGTSTWHVPDGLIRGSGADVAVEVELSHKGRQVYADEVFGRLRPGTAAVSYFVADEAFAARLRADIEAVLDGLGSPVRVSVELLPDVAGVTYRDR
jgi:hypothetical protein